MSKEKYILTGLDAMMKTNQVRLSRDSVHLPTELNVGISQIQKRAVLTLSFFPDPTFLDGTL